MLKTEALQTFVAVVQSGSLTGAAQRLHLSKSSVSARLAELEHALGVQLVQRNTRRVSLTPAGAEVFGKASQVLEQLAELSSRRSKDRGILSGTLRISGPASFGRRHLAGPLARFFAEHPQLEPTVDLEDRKVDLIGEGYDLAIRVGKLADSRLVARRLASSRRVLVCSPAYRDRHGTPRTIAELAQHQAVVYSPRRLAEEWTFSRRGARELATPIVRMRSNSPEMLLHAVLEGLGLSIMPSFMARAEVASGRLVEIPLDAELPSDGIYAIYAKSPHVPPAVRALVRHLAAEYGDQPYWDRLG